MFHILLFFFNETKLMLSLISSLYPDIISGIVTGLIVGIIIILFQKGFENRLYLKSLQRELALFKENIRFVLDKQVLFYINNIKKLPEPMDAIASLIRSNPIDLWYEKLAKQRSFLRKIKQFQNAFDRGRSCRNCFKYLEFFDKLILCHDHQD